MTKRYEIEFEFDTLAIVEIDHSHPFASQTIKDMVEFWMEWECALERANGDYVLAFLRHLGRFLVRESRIPQRDEGWARLDGSCGITVVDFTPWQPNYDDIEIKEVA